MAKIDLTSPEWCELIFKGKNKAYGAFKMRSESPKRHNLAMVIVLVIALVGFSIPTLIKIATPKQKEVMTEVTTLSQLEEPEIKQEEMKRVEPVAPPPPALKSSIKFTAPVIKKDEEVHEDDEIKSQQELTETKVAISIADVKGNDEENGKDIADLKQVVTQAEPEPEKEQPTAVADLSIADVLKMRLFYDNAAAEVREIWESREKARKALKATERLKAHPIDGLHNAGLLEPGEFVVTFAKILDKRETKLSRAERDVIHTIGMTAFNKTMKKLIADEKARNNSNGDNKQ